MTQSEHVNVATAIPRSLPGHKRGAQASARTAQNALPIGIAWQRIAQLLAERITSVVWSLTFAQELQQQHQELQALPRSLQTATAACLMLSHVARSNMISA